MSGVKRFFPFTFCFCIVVMTGCKEVPITDSLDSEELASYEVKQTSEIIAEDDFVFSLVSEKEVYDKGEKINLYGEVYYQGEKEGVMINHSSSAILLNVEEKVR